MLSPGAGRRSIRCRNCRSSRGDLVLDLGEQPASDAFPLLTDPGPDPRYPLRMWLCGACGLAQLAEDPTTPAEPRGVEPAALVEQAADAMRRAADADLLPVGASVFEYGSPHGGSWLPMLAERGLREAGADEPADVIVDSFGLMHAADQAAAITERVNRLTPRGVLLVQYHSLATIVQNGQWNALRHGHFGYYSAGALRAMLAGAGIAPDAAWEFELYGGTVLLAFSRGGRPNQAVRELISRENTRGVRNPGVLQGLQARVERTTSALRDWLADHAATGRRVVGYGAASRAVALLCRAGVDVDLLPAVVDASPAKWGRRMPGTRIPVVGPDEMTGLEPDTVLVFVPDLLDEVRRSFPALNATGVTWAVAEPEPHHLVSGNRR